MGAVSLIQSDCIMYMFEIIKEEISLTKYFYEWCLMDTKVNMDNILIIFIITVTK